MAGHSKWANIQHRKNAQDAKKEKVFTRLIRAITVAARQGGTDPDINPKLRLNIDKALANNMAKDTIERAIKKGDRNSTDNDYEEVRYEGYGPSGVAIIIDCMTNNRNRTVSEVRYTLNKHGGSLATTGALSYLFSLCGILSFSSDNDADTILQAAAATDAVDVIINDDGSIDIITNFTDLTKIKGHFVATGLAPQLTTTSWIANNKIAVPAEAMEKLQNLLQNLEELDDVQEIYTNVNE
jgi:YebC/PmpR family DNA-binding regulatory protein